LQAFGTFFASKIDSCVSRLRNFPVYRHFAVYRIHFRSARTTVLYHISSIHTPSQYISVLLHIYKLIVAPRVRHAPLPCHACPAVFLRHYFITALYKIDSRVSRLRNFLSTGTLPYTGFTFDSPERPSSLLYQLRFFYFAHFLPELPTQVRNFSSRPNQSSFLVL
jgi:hypothetical protein